MNRDEFSWVQTHKELTDFLSSKENSQLELIQLLRSVGIGPLIDKAEIGKHDIDLEEIDPFTFFCYIYKYGSKRRLGYLQKIAENLNLTIPKGESGIPSAQAQKVWLFPYKYERTNNEVGRLWNLFKKELKGQITDQDFADALLIRSTGKTKLTEALFYINPEKYFPINGPTKPYVKEVLGIDPKFNTYNEYVNILSQIKEKITIPFYELSYEAWKWNDERKKVNYWIFQGNPNVFDFETALREEILTDWTVSAHKDKIKVGDKVVLWITGDQAGCYALAEVTSEPHQKTTSPDDHLWKGEDKSELKADIKITNNLVENPILKSDIESLEELNELKVGNQGTNFSATEDEYQTLLDLISSKDNSAYSSVKNVLDSDLVNEYILFLRNYVNQNQLQPEDNRISFNVRPNKNRLVFIIGSRYALCIEKVKKITEVSFISKDALTKDSGSYTNQKKEIEAYWNRITNISAFEDKIKEGFDIELARNNKNPFRRFTNKEFIEDIYQSKIIMGENKNDTITSLNTILYGPPGTGKTYNSIDKAVTIATGSSSDHISNKKQFDELRKQGQIEFVTFHQNYSYEDFMVGIRPNVSETTSELSFKKHYGIFYQIAQRALKNYKRHNNFIDNENTEEKFQKALGIISSALIENVDYRIKMKTSEFYITSIDFSSKYLKGIRKTDNKIYQWHFDELFNDFKKVVSDLEYLKQCKLSKAEYGYTTEELLRLSNISEVEELKNFILIIDEINRANISKVFGELITLLEDDKRLGKPNELKITLPNGEKEFGVPPNLYLIGTMNTADKSIALIDIALRRRFEFIGYYPDYENEKLKPEAKTLLQKINEEIYKLKNSADYLIGHAYFMKDEAIETTLRNKVIPLLMEYFSGKTKVVSDIFNETTWKVEYDTTEFNWTISLR